jgi:phospholipid/cholesterol/gamma-HCH transport system permease protein
VFREHRMPAQFIKRGLVEKSLRDVVGQFQDFYLLSFRGCVSVFKPPWNRADILDQMEYMGADAVIIVSVLAAFIGMALSIQAESAFANIGGLQTYACSSIGISIISEIGPVLTGIVFAGRSGAGMASELGSMVLDHQVDTLRVFGIDPVKKLVAPRVLASLIMVPCLTIIGDCVALLGGAYITSVINHISPNVYWSSIRSTFEARYMVTGLMKPVVFGAAVASAGCFMGLTAKGGARGLRNATTAAFLLSALCIIVADFLITKLSLFGG